MNTNVLAKTLALLAQHRVKRFKGNGLDVELDPITYPKADAFVSGMTTSPQLGLAVNPFVTTANLNVNTAADPKQQPIDPNNFTGNDMMSFDKILHWSSSPEVGDTGLPLTGDQPLQPGIIPTPVAAGE